jgi:hypothetical protein
MKGYAAPLFADQECWQSILQSPEYFLHSIDVLKLSFTFIKTSRETLARSSFLDGRSALSKSDSHYVLPIKEALSWHQKSSENSSVNSSVNRFIFHMSFCGSTLISRVLECPEVAITYKEPQIFLQLAEIKAANADWYSNKEQWRSLMSFVLSQQGKRWSPDEPVVIKPSNWANSMLPQLIESGDASRVLFLSTSPRDFLISVFRGGSERVQFTYAVLKHLLTAFPEFTKTVAEVEADKLTTADMFARLSLIVHAIQCKAFERARSNLSLQDHYQCSYQELLESPVECMQHIAAALDLWFSNSQLNQSISNSFINHSKVTQRDFNTIEAKKIDQQVLAVYGETFARTFDWAERSLIPSNFF